MNDPDLLPGVRPLGVTTKDEVRSHHRTQCLWHSIRIVVSSADAGPSAPQDTLAEQSTRWIKECVTSMSTQESAGVAHAHRIIGLGVKKFLSGEGTSSTDATTILLVGRSHVQPGKRRGYP